LVDSGAARSRDVMCPIIYAERRLPHSRTFPERSTC
jgi:hypothetical protein